MGQQYCKPWAHSWKHIGTQYTKGKTIKTYTCRKCPKVKTENKPEK